MDHEDDENLSLGPVSERPRIEWTVGSEASPEIARAAVAVSGSHRIDSHDASVAGLRAASDPRTDQHPRELDPRDFRQQPSGGVASGMENELPVHRSYPTLESITHLYRLFGYVGVAGVFGYLLFKFYRNVWHAEQGHRLEEFESFVAYALPYIFGSVVGAGVLFGASEAIKLAIDIQENTLASARRSMNNHHSQMDPKR